MKKKSTTRKKRVPKAQTGYSFKSSEGGKAVTYKSKTPTSKITKGMAEGRTAYTQAAMEGGKLPEKKFRNSLEQTRYLHILSRRIGNSKVTQAEKDRAYKQAIAIRKNKK